MPLMSRTRATLRSAEFGFFGVVVNTRVQTPRRWGAPWRAGDLVLVVFDSRPLRTSCWIVGTRWGPRGESETDVLGVVRRPRVRTPADRPNIVRPGPAHGNRPVARGPRARS